MFEAGFGVPGIPTMLPLLYDRGVRTGRTGLERHVNVLATAPAQRLAFGGRKGAIAPGFDADLVLFDPSGPFTIGATSEHLVDEGVWAARRR